MFVQGVNFTPPARAGSFSQSFGRGLQTGMLFQDIRDRKRKRAGEAALAQVLTNPAGADGGYSAKQLASIRSLNPTAGQQLASYQLELKRYNAEQRKERREQDALISDRAGRMFYGMSQVEAPAERMEVLHNYYRMAEASGDPIMVQAVKRVGIQLGLGQDGQQPQPGSTTPDQMFSDERMAAGLSSLLAGDMGLRALIKQADNKAAAERIRMQGEQNRQAEELRHGNTLTETTHRGETEITVDQVTGSRLLDAQLHRDRERHKQSRELLGVRDEFHEARTGRAMEATGQRQNRALRNARMLAEGKHLDAIEIEFLRDEMRAIRDERQHRQALEEADYENKLAESLAKIKNENVLEQLGFRRGTGRQHIEQRGDQALEQIEARGRQDRLTEDYRQKNRESLAKIRSRLRGVERAAKAGDDKALELWKSLVGAARTQASQDERMVQPSEEMSFDTLYKALTEEGTHDTLRQVGRALGVEISDVPVRRGAGGTRGGGTSRTRGTDKPVWRRMLEQ